MNRRSFLVALAGVAASPRLVRRLVTRAEVLPAFVYWHPPTARWYVYPVMTNLGIREVRSTRRLTHAEIVDLAYEQLPEFRQLHTLHT